MTLRMEGQTLLLQLAVWACFGAFVVSFAVALWVNIRVLGRTGCLVNRSEDQDLSWGERQGRKHSRFDRFLVAEEFRSLRKVAFTAWTGAALSFASLLLLIFLFGEGTSH